MNVLTSQDQENYGKLRTAATEWKNAVNKLDNSYNVIKALVSKLVDELLPKPLNSSEELENRYKLVESYLSVEQDLEAGVPLPLAEQKAIAPLQQAFLTQLAHCKAAYSHSKCPPIDDFTTPCRDELFFGFITDSEAEKWTQTLLDRKIPCLNRHQIQQLIGAWECAIQTFVEDAQKKSELGGKVSPGKPETLAHFFCIRDELETLYDRLSPVSS